jgi:hypothetical protein
MALSKATKSQINHLFLEDEKCSGGKQPSNI